MRALRSAMPRLRQFGTDHHSHKLVRRYDARVAFTRNPAIAEHRRAIAQSTYLVELVADVNNAAAFARDAAQPVEQRIDGLRRQHRSRLVHDEETRALQQAAN